MIHFQKKKKKSQSSNFWFSIWNINSIFGWEIIIMLTFYAACTWQMQDALVLRTQGSTEGEYKLLIDIYSALVFKHYSCTNRYPITSHWIWQLNIFHDTGQAMKPGNIKRWQTDLWWDVNLSVKYVFCRIIRVIKIYLVVYILSQRQSKPELLLRSV